MNDIYGIGGGEMWGGYPSGTMYNAILGLSLKCLGVILFNLGLGGSI